MSFEKVFEIAPIFRAEPSRTNRHLSEAISIDFEESYVDYNDIMERIEHIVKRTISVIQKFSNDNSGTKFTIPDMPNVIPQYTYTLNFLKKFNPLVVKINGVMIFILHN